MKVISTVDHDVHTVILDVDDVSMLDTTAMTNLESIASDLAGRDTRLVLVNVSPRLHDKMQRYGLLDKPGISIEADVSTALSA